MLPLRFLAQIRLDKLIQLAIEDFMDLRGLMPRSRVLDQRVRLHGVSANLVTHRHLALFVVGLFDLGASLLLLDAIKLRLEELESHGVVLVLAALAAALG